MYLGQDYVFIKRQFVYDGQIMADIIFDEEQFTVPLAHLTDKPTRVGYGLKGDKQDRKIEAEVDGSSIEVNKDETIIKSEEVIIEEVEAADPSDRVAPRDEESKQEKMVLISKAVNGEKVDSIPISELGGFIKKKKLNKDAVQLVLDGKQKTHKGFKFETI